MGRFGSDYAVIIAIFIPDVTLNRTEYLEIVIDYYDKGKFHFVCCEYSVLLFLFSFFCGNGEAYRKFGSSWLRFYFDFTIVMLHDPAHNVQSYSGSLAYFFRSKKRIKYFGQYLLRNAAAIIDDLYFYIFSITRGFYDQFTILVHGINGIIDYVSPHLFQLANISGNIHQVIAICFF